MGIKWFRDTEGSVTIETAVLFPVLIVVLLFGCACIRLCVDSLKIEQCFYDTAEALSDYAYLYHEKTISQITERWKSNREEQDSSFLEDLLAEVPEDMVRLFDLQDRLEAYKGDWLDQAESQIYVPIARGLFQHHIRQAGLENKISHINFSGSSFFLTGHEIRLHMTCSVSFSLPFFQKNKVDICYQLRINAWVNGIGGVEDTAEDDVWTMDNFSRGKKIRSLYGGNLPDAFPTVSKFQNGRVTMIKSLDFRKATYQTADAVSKNITIMLETLSAYAGQSTPYGKEKIVIRPEQIREKELLLVIPDTEQSELIKTELAKAKRLAEQYHIIFTVRKL